MKKAISVSLIATSLFVCTQILADAPACPNLRSAGYTQYDTSNAYSSNWTAFYNGGPAPLNGGGLIVTNATGAQQANYVAANAMNFAQASGPAQKVSWPDGSWFWACNYTPPTRLVIQIAFFSPTYGSDGKLTATVHTLQDKLKAFRSSVSSKK